MVVDSSLVAVTLTSDIAPVSNKEFVEIRVSIERCFTLKRVLDMIRTHRQMHRTDSYSK